MTNRLIFFLLMGTTMLGAASPSQEPDYHEYHGNLPRQLRELAQKIDCGPVPGFYDRPSRVDPPYLYGWPLGNKEETAVFWCYRKQEEKPYLLVFAEGLSHGRKGRVTDTIRWNDYPGGLLTFNIRNVQWYDSEGVRLTDSEHLPLSEFFYVDTKEPGPKGKTTKYAPLQESYDGVITLYYRHEGRWLFTSFD